MASAYLESIQRPHILELPGTPEIFCDVGICMDYGESVRVMLAAAVDPAFQNFELVGKIFFPKGGFRRSLLWAVEDFCPIVGLH